MTRRFAGIVIGCQTVVVFLASLVAFAIARAQGETSHTAYLVVGLVLAVLCVVAAGTLRRRWGVTLGWLIEIATLAAAVIVPMLLVVGLIFLALWVTALVQGRKMDRLTHDFTEKEKA